MGLSLYLGLGMGGSGLADVWWVLSGAPFWWHFSAGRGIVAPDQFPTSCVCLAGPGRSQCCLGSTLVVRGLPALWVIYKRGLPCARGVWW